MGEILIDVCSEDGICFKSSIERVLMFELAQLDLTGLLPEVIKAIAVIKRSELAKKIKSSNYYEPSAKEVTFDEGRMHRISDYLEETILRAVNETRGIIGVSSGGSVELYYTKCCCGGTANSEDILGHKINYLRRVICKKCSQNSLNSIIKIDDYAERINKKVTSFKGDISNILRDVKRDETGRILSINFLGEEMTGEEFMEFFNMPTNRVYFLENSIEFKAMGEGLGLGICLLGANDLAEQELGYEDIIKYYYTGVEIKSLDERELTDTLLDKKIVIDPGHGGEDNGNVSGDIAEKDVNFYISLGLKDMLESIGCKTLLTREEDVDIPLGERVKFINRERPDFYISIHQNSFILPGVNGVEVYCYEGDDESNRLGKLICDEISSAIEVKNRGVRYGDYYLLRECKVNGLSIECMYLTGNNDINKYSEKNYKKISMAIFKAICKYYGIEE